MFTGPRTLLTTSAVSGCNRTICDILRYPCRVNGVHLPVYTNGSLSEQVKKLKEQIVYDIRIHKHIEQIPSQDTATSIVNVPKFARKLPRRLKGSKSVEAIRKKVKANMSMYVCAIHVARTTFDKEVNEELSRSTGKHDLRKDLNSLLNQSELFLCRISRDGDVVEDTCLCETFRDVTVDDLELTVQVIVKNLQVFLKVAEGKLKKAEKGVKCKRRFKRASRNRRKGKGRKGRKSRKRRRGQKGKKRNKRKSVCKSV